AKIIHTVPLRYVGVFQNQKIDYVIFIAITLQLHAVQLHGNENQQYIYELRQKLSDNIEIWKVFSISDTIPIKYFDCVKYFIFDNHTGGSGITFNWNLLTQSIPNNVLLAGGLNLNNCIKASCLGFCGLDFNSGIEKLPGIKDHQKIYLIFKKLKNSFL
ncbi:bifunctional indole-3-glycerol phosphate synthase/phosphoribosylanthranilate isomerase, partial [Buchnera aphidicola (Hormaphis cornu)]